MTRDPYISSEDESDDDEFESEITQHAKNVRPDIKERFNLSNQDCEDRARLFGENWANIMCGLGDQ